MAELDTAAEREAYPEKPDSPGVLYASRRYLNEIDRLQAENQRLEERHEAMADALVTEVTKRGYLRDEVASVLQLMDGLAEQWGDEGVFRRCRDRLRAIITEDECNG